MKMWLLLPLKAMFQYGYSPIYKRNIANELVPLIPNKSRVLDFGCDDGSIAKMMMLANPSLKIEGVDIQNYRTCQIKRTLYDGKVLPFKSKTFDVVIAVDVLHHITDIPGTLNELKRVSKKGVIVKDHVVYGKLTYLMVCLTDYVSNVAFGIKCVFNYLTMKEWKKLFKISNLDITQQPKKLNFGFGIGVKYNPVFVLQRREV